MRQVKSGSVAVVPVLFGALVLLGACSSTGMDRSEKARASMAAVEEDIGRVAPQIELTNAALEEVLTPGQTDVGASFAKYSREVEKMEKLGGRVFQHADRMRESRSEYFEEWRKDGSTYTNPDIQALSEQRRADLNAVFARIPAASVGVRGDLNSYLSKVTEIRTYLSNDLTERGVQTITPTARDAVRQGEALKESIKPLQATIGEARSELAQPSPK